VGKPGDDYTNAFIINKKSTINNSLYATNPFEDYLIMYTHNINTVNGGNNILLNPKENKTYLGVECKVTHNSAAEDSALVIVLLIQEKTYIRGVTYYFPTTEMMINRNEESIVKKLIDTSAYTGKVVGV
jgi:hypothetical protein